jgi:OOP family OmpA-OmpF porin
MKLLKLFSFVALIALIGCASNVEVKHPVMTDNVFVDVCIEAQKIVIKETVFFDFDKSNIRPDAAETLKEVAAILKDNPEIKVLVEAHTDKIGTDTYNQKLSERRAASVKKFLEDNGVENARVEAIGLGETQLIPGTNAENRRAVIMNIE